MEPHHPKMPGHRKGAIPPTRLSRARRARDQLRRQLGAEGYAILDIHRGGYAVRVRLFEGGAARREDIPSVVDGIPVRVDGTRWPRPRPRPQSNSAGQG